MNRKKALYRYELGNMKWFLVAGMAGCLLVLFFFHDCYRQMTALESAFDGSGMMYFSGVTSFVGTLAVGMTDITTIALIALSVMVMFQFKDYHERNRREFIVALPFSQRERFVAKFVVGCGIITVICAVFCVGVFALRSVYYPSIVKQFLVYPYYQLLCGNDTWFQTLRVVLLLWVTMLAAYAVFTVVHTLISRGIIASLVSIGVMATPYYLLCMSYVYAEMFRPAGNHHAMFDGTLAQVCRAFLGRAYLKETVEIGVGDIDTISTSTYVDFGSLWAVFLTVIIVFVICTILSYRINAKQDGAKYGATIPQTGPRVFFSVGIALCFSFPIASLLSFFMGKDGVDIVVAVVQIIVMIVLYLVNQKIFKRVIR